MRLPRLFFMTATSLVATTCLANSGETAKQAVVNQSADKPRQSEPRRPEGPFNKAKDPCLAAMESLVVDGTGELYVGKPANSPIPPIKAPAIEGPVVVAERIGYLGGRRERFEERMNKIFGKGNWEIRHRVGDEIITRAEALQLYEDGYYEFFKGNPQVAKELAERASDVYDTHLSNLQSGFDYEKQETPHQHLQDIAIRRAMARLGYRFKGKEPLQVRGHDSPLYHLNPGKIPFHKPEIISQKRIFEADWVDRNSIEDFWQNNKFVVVRGGETYLKGLQAEVHDLLKRSKSDQYRILSQKLLVLLLAGRVTDNTLAQAAGYFHKAKHPEATEELAIDYVNIVDNARLGIQPDVVCGAVHQLLRPTANVEGLTTVYARIQSPEIRAAFGLAAASQGSPTVGQDWIMSALASDKAAMEAIAANPALVQFGRDHNLFQRGQEVRLTANETQLIAERFRIFRKP